jgi:hypothetical protein
MNKEQQELLDEAYKNYSMSYKDGHEFYEDEMIKRSYTQEEFINKCKTDSEFSGRWGLKIEERELSLEERNNYYTSNYLGLDETKENLDKMGIPTKLITITYNNKTIESYE